MKSITTMTGMKLGFRAIDKTKEETLNRSKPVDTRNNLNGTEIRSLEAFRKPGQEIRDHVKLEHSNK